MIVIRKPVDAGAVARYLPYTPSRPDLQPPVLTLHELREWRARLIAPLLLDGNSDGVTP